jgi:hypothetical protein
MGIGMDLCHRGKIAIRRRLANGTDLCHSEARHARRVMALRNLDTPDYAAASFILRLAVSAYRLIK